MAIAYNQNLVFCEYKIVSNKEEVLLDISPQNIESFNIVHDMFNKYSAGNILLFDYDYFFDIVPIYESIKLKVKFKDNYGKLVTNYYNITNVDKSLYQQKVYMVKLTIMDELSYTLSRLSISKSFPNSTIGDSLKWFIEQTNNYLYGEYIINDLTTDINEFLITPLNENIFNFYHSLCMEDDINLYFDGEQLNIIPFEQLISSQEDLSSDLFFSTEQFQSNHPYKIYDMDVQLLDKFESLQKNHNYLDFDFDITDKSPKNNLSYRSYENIISQIQQDGMLYNIQDKIGASSNCPHYENIFKNFIVEFTINGINQLKLGTIVGMNAEIPTNTTKALTFSGKYMVSRISTKIKGLAFVQRLQLTAPSILPSEFKRV